MSYISKDEVKQVRENLKKAFGTRFKFSVTGGNSSSLYVSIMQGDVLDWSGYENLHDEYMLDAWQIENQIQRTKSIQEGKFDINHYHIPSSWLGEALEVFNEILKCCQIGEGSYDRNAGDMGADYCNMTYFINISVGKWNKPYLALENQKVA